MKLFIRTSNKSSIQKQLDAERESTAQTAVEETPVEQQALDEQRPLVGKPKKTVFHVDLMGGWVKP